MKNSSSTQDKQESYSSVKIAQWSYEADHVPFFTPICFACAKEQENAPFSCNYYPTSPHFLVIIIPLLHRKQKKEEEAKEGEREPAAKSNTFHH